MNNFKVATTAIMGLFASFPVTAVPSDFVGQPLPYVRITPLFNSSDTNRLSLSGLLMVDVFVLRGNGPIGTMEIADSLETLMSNKQLTVADGSVVQFGAGSLGPSKIDKDNETISRSVYSIPFNFFRRY